MCIIKTPFPGYLGDSSTTSNPGEEAITDYALMMMMVVVMAAVMMMTTWILKERLSQTTVWGPISKNVDFQII